MTEPGHDALHSGARTLRRHIVVIVLCLLLAPATALVVSQRQQKLYTAEGSLLFADPGLEASLLGSSSQPQSFSPQRQTATNVALVSLPRVARRAARRLKIADADTVARKIDVVPEGDSDLVSVTATDPDPSRAAKLANTFAEEFIAFRQSEDRSKVEQAQRLIDRQLSRLSPVERRGRRGQQVRRRLQELAVLASLQTGNAELVQRASVPTAPSSPRLTRNMLFGLLLGLLLGVTLAVIRERLDHRFRDPHDIQEAYDLPILARIPHSRALGGVTRPVLLTPTAVDGLEVESFRALNARLRRLADGAIRSVVVTSAAPGEGKTTVALNLAMAAARAGTRALIIEADLRRPVLAPLMKGKGLSLVLAGEQSFADALGKYAVTSSGDYALVPYGGSQIAGSETDALELHALPAGPIPPNPDRLIESDQMLDLIREAEQQYGLVVIDTPPTVVADALSLNLTPDALIIVARLNRSTRDAADELRDVLASISSPVAGLVVNGTKLTGSVYYGYVRGAEASS